MNAASPPGRAAPPHSRFADACVLAATMSGSSIAIIDATAVNVALPAIQRGFDADIAALQWVVESYALFLAALILVGGVLGDHLGRKRLFAIGTVIFAAASAWCGLAPDIEQLIVARAVQGVGAALVVPGSLALLSAHFPTERRGRAIGQWASYTTLAIALGPVLGGVLVDVASWRWVFFINLPIAVFLLAVLYAGVPESRDESAARKLDIAGAVLITLGLGGLVFGLLESSRLGFASGLVWAPMVAGLVIIIMLILRQWLAASPMLPLSLFRSRAFSGANVMTFLLYGAMSGSLFFLPFNLMQVQGWSATEAGAALLPLILAIAIFSFGAGRLVARFGQRLPLVVGGGIAALGFALLALPGAASAYWSGFFPGLAVVGLGLGIAVAPLTIVVMAAVPANRAGLASGVNNSASRVAMLMAVALFGVVMFEIYSGHLRAALDSLALDGASRAMIEAHMSDLAGLQAPAGLDAGTAARLHGAVGGAFVAGFRAVAVISAAAALLGAIITASWYKLVTMRTPLSELNGARFDVAVIGAGVNGASAAQHLAAAGFRTLLVEQNDFASGSSSRSSRLLHCGLRYLAPGSSAWEFAFHPRRLMKALSMARQAMEARSQIVRETPERVRPMTFSYPIYKETPYAPWQVDLAFKILKELGPNDVPLDYRRLGRGEARRLPLLEWLRDIDALKGIAQFREYRFDWPERIALDAVLDAARLGAEVRNHTALKGLERQADGDWRLVLEDKLADAAAGEVSVMAGAVVNTAGIWIDRVNRMAAADAARRITGTKGIHCMFRLPPECADEGIASMNRDDEPIYCVPWRGLHYLGPTETLYEGDIDDIRPEEDEIEWLLGEANYLLPGAEFKRANVLFAWAGVRPLTYDPAQPKGARSRELHDLSADGLDNMFALTAGPIMTHRSAGELLTKRVARRVRPSGTPGRLSYAASKFPDDTNSPAIDDEWPEATFADLRHAAAHEMPANLVDLLFRRSGNGWTASMAAPMAERAAREVAAAMGWDDARIEAEAKAYRAHVAHNHLWHGSGS